MEQRDLRILIIVVLILFVVYIIMKGWSQKMKKKLEEKKRFGQK